MKIETAEKLTGWFIEKEAGMFCAKDDNFVTQYEQKRLRDLVEDLKCHNAEQELIYKV